MSINVTVNGNPVSIRRGRMVLSDLDEIKKNERDRRRKLRLEQVREQSKQISNRLLERAKNVRKAELTKLEKDGKSELRQIHDQKIMNLQRKYREDMEDIGRAHASASIQPDDFESLMETEKKKNRFIAVERGKEALEIIKESNQTENDKVSSLRDRQKQVRDTENARASMIANLPKKLTDVKESTDRDSDSVSVKKRMRKSTKKKRDRKGNDNYLKSIPKVVVRSPDYQVVVRDKKAKRSDREAGPSGRQGIRKTDTETDTKRSYASGKTLTDQISEFPSVGVYSDSDDQEPRKSLPRFNSPRKKGDKLASYNPEDYKPDSTSSGSFSNSNSSSSSSSSSTTSLSDDSSYFSDGVGIDSSSFVKKKTPRHTTSAASSKVQLYDHDTRQRNYYDKPFGIVERMKIYGEPNAEEIANAVTVTEKADIHLTETRKRDALRRGNDAILRDKVRRDYENLLKNLDQFSRDERMLKASQIHGPIIKDIHLNPLRRKELLKKHQTEMNYALESNLQDKNEDEEKFILRNSERVVTIPVNDNDDKEIVEEGSGNMADTPSAVWQEAPFFEPSLNVDEIHVDKNYEEISRNEQILEMLRKVERQKRLLLKEFGADLPDDVFTASVKPLFDDNVRKELNLSKKKLKKTYENDDNIKVINMSSCDETKENKKLNKLKNKVPKLLKKHEIAVQTSSIENDDDDDDDYEKSVAIDKGVQVELINVETIKKNIIVNKSTSEEMIDDKKSYDDDDKDFEESNSVSSDSVETTGIVIDIKKKRVKLTPRKKRSNLKISRGNSPRVVAKPRSVSVVKVSTPTKRPSKSLPVSKKSTPRLSENNVKINIDKGNNIKLKINEDLSSSRDASTESSKSLQTITDLSRDKITQASVSKNVRDTSDTSTSYTSPPPPPTPASYRSARDNSTPILEILEISKGRESILKKPYISPVSSPGTPSPRTINLPTNTPHSRHINRVLEYFDSTVSQSTDNTISLSLPGRQSTPNEIQNLSTAKKFTDKSSDVCLCNNPECGLKHLNMRDLDNETLKNYPDILLKYQDLKSMCTDRIASLTDLIEKVRNDKKGIELSVGGQSDDESSIFLLPGSTRMPGDLYSVRKLVDSIEAVHNQLAKTIDESQRIIGVKKRFNDSFKSVDDENSSLNKIDARSNKESIKRILPKIISSERVNVPLSQFNIITKEQKPLSPVDEKNNLNLKEEKEKEKEEEEEEVVERLSKEILEQSKTLDNILTDFRSTNINESNNLSDSFSTRRKSTSSPKKERDDDDDDRSNNFDNQFINSASKTEKDEDFVPLLAGIPKVQRMLPNATSDNRRPRPPVTLIHGPRSVQTGSPGHELSTIVEFDTPDTASKSQKSIRSPTGEKIRKNLIKNYKNLIKKSDDESSERTEIPITLENSKKLIKSGNVARPESKSPKIMKKLKKEDDSKLKKELIFRDAGTSSGYCDSDKDCELISCPKSFENKKKLESFEKERENNIIEKKEISTDSSCSIPDISAEFIKRNLLFHARMITTTTETTDRIPFRNNKKEDSLDDNNEEEDKIVKKCLSTDTEKDIKITSTTSSNSYSGLSGISEITSTPTSDIFKYTSSPEEMETALKKLGLGWAITTLKKTREASALSSSSNSDATTPLMQSKKLTTLSSSSVALSKKDIEKKINCLNNLSDVSSISIKDANKSTERAILLKARTSTPNIENSNSSSDKNSSSINHSSSSRLSIQDQTDSLTAPNLSLVSYKKSPNFDKQLNGA